MVPRTLPPVGDHVPAVSLGVHAMASGDGLCLFDAATGRARALNRTAADVFALVDGVTATSEIVETLAAAYRVRAHDVEQSVFDLVAQLCADGLLTVELSSPT